jgi:hypothetical protein
VLPLLRLLRVRMDDWMGSYWYPWMVNDCQKVKTPGAAKFAAFRFRDHPTSGSIPMKCKFGTYASHFDKLKIRAESAGESSVDPYPE